MLKAQPVGSVGTAAFAPFQFWAAPGAEVTPGRTQAALGVLQVTAASAGLPLACSTNQISHSSPISPCPWHHLWHVLNTGAFGGPQDRAAYHGATQGLCQEPPVDCLWSLYTTATAKKGSAGESWVGSLP